MFNDALWDQTQPTFVHRAWDSWRIPYWQTWNYVCYVAIDCPGTNRVSGLITVG